MITSVRGGLSILGVERLEVTDRLFVDIVRDGAFSRGVHLVAPMGLPKKLRAEFGGGCVSRSFRTDGEARRVARQILERVAREWGLTVG